MAKTSSAKRKRSPKSVLKLPDLEQSKTAVLNSLTAACSQRTYERAIREFIDWYCSEPRLAFNKTVVTRYRISLEQRQYAPATINHRLAAVRRLAYEAADCGLLSADLAAGIRRVKGARRLGIRIGNWLTVEEGKRMIGAFGSSNPRQLRNQAMVAVLIGCGLRRAEAAALRVEDIQLREGHWIIADLKGNGGHIRTVPVPDWVKARIDAWTSSACLTTGIVFRAINEPGETASHRRSSGPSSRRPLPNLGCPVWLPMISAGPVRVYAIKLGVNWSRSSSFSVTFRSKPPNATSAASSVFAMQ